MALLVWMGCEPFEEDGMDLPSPPVVNADWYFLPDTVDGVIGIDSNTVVFEAETMDEVFMHFWDFGNGKTSDMPVDTMIYYAEGTYGISYQGHGAGGMHSMQDSIRIERTLELPCEGVLASLTGCDNPKAWKLSQEAGSVSVGPEPMSGEWYASPANEIVEFQADDRWQLSEDGVEMRAAVEGNAAKNGRPHFGWRDIAEVEGEENQRPTGALAPPSTASKL